MLALFLLHSSLSISSSAILHSHTLVFLVFSKDTLKLYSIYPLIPQSNSLNIKDCSPPPSLFTSFLIFFPFIYRCYNMLYLCLYPFFLPQVRGSLDYARDDGTLLSVDTRVDINPSRDFRYTLKRSICAIALDMP